MVWPLLSMCTLSKKPPAFSTICTINRLYGRIFCDSLRGGGRLACKTVFVQFSTLDGRPMLLVRLCLTGRSPMNSTLKRKGPVPSIAETGPLGAFYILTRLYIRWDCSSAISRNPRTSPGFPGQPSSPAPAPPWPGLHSRTECPRRGAP